MSHKPKELEFVQKQITVDEWELINTIRDVKYGIVEIHVVASQPNKVEHLDPKSESAKSMFEVFSVAKTTRIGMIIEDRFK